MKLMQWIHQLFMHRYAEVGAPGYLEDQVRNTQWLKQEEERQLLEVKDRLDRVEQKLESVLRKRKGDSA